MDESERRSSLWSQNVAQVSRRTYEDTGRPVRRFRGKALYSEDIRFTVNHGCIYAFCLNMKGRDSICIKSLAETKDMSKTDFSGIIRGIEVLGEEEAPQWTRDQDGLKIKTKMIEHNYPVVFKISVN